jgi:O-antigen ligase
MKLLDKLLILFFVSVTIFRIDLASGKLGFVLTPGLVLAFFLIIILLTVLLLSNTVKISVQLLLFSIVLIGIAFWFLAVTISFKDIIQIRRLILFYIIILSTFSFFLLFHYSAHKQQIIHKFIFTSLNVYLFFSALQIFFFINGKHYGQHEEIFTFIDLYPASIGPYFPRLNGGFIDPNVGGYFLTFLYILIYHFNLSKSRIWLISLLIFLTLSRSAIITFLFVLICNHAYLYWLKHKDNGTTIMIKKHIVYKTSIALVAFIISTCFILFYTPIGERFLDAISARLGNEDNSTSIHLGLFQIAIKKIFDNPVNFVIGYGFGSSFLFTQSYFPDNKYGNFHSELITIFVETGLVGFILFISVLIIPLIQIFIKSTLRKSFYIILLIISIFLQNIFYQQYLFQYYWIIIGFIWYLTSTKISNIQNSSAT